ncbi:MAG: hypothetical protein AAB587_01360 [Patescibacteria group bacterium]
MANNVEFYEENTSSSLSRPRDTRTKLIKFIMGLGWAKNEKQANTTLIVIGVAAFALTIFVLISSSY